MTPSAVVVMVATLGVRGTSTAWPDLTVAASMAGLFCISSVQMLRQAWAEYREESDRADGVPAK
jgi:Co/Zn/Cd efflux system component